MRVQKNKNWKFREKRDMFLKRKANDRYLCMKNNKCSEKDDKYDNNIMWNILFFMFLLYHENSKNTHTTHKAKKKIIREAGNKNNILMSWKVEP
jgi:hypothetical protein